MARVRMQWAAGHFLPAVVVAAHVTRMGGRPLPFACAVAMSARFGFDLDLDPAGLSPDDLGVCRRAVEVYRSVRDLVQLGDLWRLVSPFVAVALAGDGAGGERAALAYVAPDATRAAVFAYQLEDGVPAAVPLAGLDAALTYAVHPIDLTGDEPPPSFAVPGADLLRDGLPWESATAETAAIWLLGSTA